MWCECYFYCVFDVVVGVCVWCDVVMCVFGDEDEMISNLDKLFGDFGVVLEREELVAASSRALDAEVKADGARVVADLVKV